MFVNSIKSAKRKGSTYEILGARGNNIEKFQFKNNQMTFFKYNEESKKFEEARTKKSSPADADRILIYWCSKGFEIYCYCLRPITKTQERVFVNQIKNQKER